LTQDLEMNGCYTRSDSRGYTFRAVNSSSSQPFKPECSFTNSVTSDRLMIAMILDFCVSDGSICSNKGDAARCRTVGEGLRGRDHQVHPVFRFFTCDGP